MEPHTHRKEKATHKVIFSWLSWLEVLLMDAYTMVTMTELRNMAAIHQIQVDGDMHSCIVASFFVNVMVNLQLTKQNVSADQYHVTILWA